MPLMLPMPIFGVIAGLVFVDEPLTPGLVAGGGLTVIGAGIITVRRPRLVAPEAERI